MTKKERKIILKAMWYLHTDEEKGGDYHKGMDLLSDLVGDTNHSPRCLWPAKIDLSR